MSFFELFEFDTKEISVLSEVMKIVSKYNSLTKYEGSNIMYFKISDTEISYKKKNGLINVINANISDYKKNNKRKFFHNHEMRKRICDKNNNSIHNIENVIEEEDNENEQSEDFDELAENEVNTRVEAITTQKKSALEVEEKTAMEVDNETELILEVNREIDNIDKADVDIDVDEVNNSEEAIAPQENIAMEVEEEDNESEPSEEVDELFIGEEGDSRADNKNVEGDNRADEVEVNVESAEVNIGDNGEDNRADNKNVEGDNRADNKNVEGDNRADEVEVNFESAEVNIDDKREENRAGNKNVEGDNRADEVEVNVASVEVSIGVNNREDEVTCAEVNVENGIADKSYIVDAESGHEVNNRVGVDEVYYGEEAIAMEIDYVESIINNGALQENFFISNCFASFDYESLMSTDQFTNYVGTVGFNDCFDLTEFGASLNCESEVSNTTTEIPVPDVSSTSTEISNIPVSDVSNTSTELSNIPVPDVSSTSTEISNIPVSDVSSTSTEISNIPVPDVSNTSTELSYIPVPDVSSTSTEISNIPVSDVSSTSTEISNILVSDVSNSDLSIIDSDISIFDVSSASNLYNVSSEKRRRHKDILKREILSLESFEYRYNEVLQYKEEVDFKSVLENCVVSEIKSEVLNCHLLIYYYRIGEFLYKILTELKDYLSVIVEKNIITGLIKGTGIASSFKNIYKKYSANESRKARILFNKSIRVYKVYKHFPNPIIQMYRAENITANKFLKVGGSVWVNEDFNEFVEEVKVEITKNFDKYKLGVEYTIVFGNDLHVSNEILENVKKFSSNPTLSLD